MNLIEKYLGEGGFNLHTYHTVLKKLQDQKARALHSHGAAARFGSWIAEIEDIEKAPIELVWTENHRMKAERYKNLKAAVAHHPDLDSGDWIIGMRGHVIDGVSAIRIESGEANAHLSI